MVAATNRDLQQMIADNQFREDLYFRLQIFPITLPPLRQRQEDIPLLARYAIESFAHHLDRPVPVIAPTALQCLQAYEWPGNVRELEHSMQRAVLRCQNERIEVQDVTGDLELKTVLPRADAADLLHGETGEFIPMVELEKQYIVKALEATGWVIFGEKGAARLLDMNPQTLRSRMRKHGLRRPQSAKNG